ncbi:CII family transcriptional regulator [Lelliottia wanjuensis]|uniref:CII family transcriptional regulator n=1 Tax=Lelliottia wanjuensis TaxID=3050585 RepID=A0AAP4FXB7_9ENTR|nr:MULTISPECIES: CII family transcriptional regulator [unclassified Lelliottia]MDK9365367.1 CII family transcriptional regulator [Lelliottia sp. V106_12]MDK9617900.1 CII family transcriptional regulator [Lelliottia sp. V106_9]
METSTARNKTEARRIETWIQNEMATLGITTIAGRAGVNKSTVSRWRTSVVPAAAMLFSILMSERQAPKGDMEA